MPLNQTLDEKKEGGVHHRFNTLAMLVLVTFGFSIYYLYEVNAFQRAQQADPTLVRKPGACYELLELTWPFLVFTPALIGLAFNVVRARRLGLSWNSWLDWTWDDGPQDQFTRTRNLLIGLIDWFVIGLLIVSLIRVSVWETNTFDSPLWLCYLLMWPLVVEAVWLVLKAIRDTLYIQRVGTYHTSSGQPLH